MVIGGWCGPAMKVVTELGYRREPEIPFESLQRGGKRCQCAEHHPDGEQVLEWLAEWDADLVIKRKEDAFGTCQDIRVLATQSPRRRHLRGRTREKFHPCVRPNLIVV